MGKVFIKSGSIKDEDQYKKIIKELAESVPSSVLSFDDKPCTLRIIDLIEVKYGEEDGKSYAAFLCKDETRTYSCQLPVFYVRKVFSGYAVDGTIIAGKCRGTFVDTLEDKEYSWEAVSGLIKNKIRVHNVVKILSESNGRKVTHRVYTIDLV